MVNVYFNDRSIQIQTDNVEIIDDKLVIKRKDIVIAAFNKDNITGFVMM